MNIDALLSRMTLRQKLAQMTQLDYTFFAPEEGGEITGPLHRMGIREEDVDCCGSVLNITGAALTRRVQEEHLKKDPNRIPLLFMRDVIHGFRTIFPIPLALGCSWNPALMRQSAASASRSPPRVCPKSADSSRSPFCHLLPSRYASHKATYCLFHSTPCPVCSAPDCTDRE